MMASNLEIHQVIVVVEYFARVKELLCLGGNVELFLNLLLQVFDAHALRDLKIQLFVQECA